MESAGIAARITPGNKGQFDVVAGERLVFSKQDVGRFPEEDEIMATLDVRSRQTG